MPGIQDPLVPGAAGGPAQWSNRHPRPQLPGATSREPTISRTQTARSKQTAKYRSHPFPRPEIRLTDEDETLFGRIREYVPVQGDLAFE